MASCLPYSHSHARKHVSDHNYHAMPCHHSWDVVAVFYFFSPSSLSPSWAQHVEEGLTVRAYRILSIWVGR